MVQGPGARARRREGREGRAGGARERGRAEREEGPSARGRRKGREREREKKRKWEKEREKKKKKKEGGGKWRERKGGIRADAMRPRPATRDGRVRSIAGGIRGVVYGRSATRASRGEEDGTTGVRDREMISGFEV